VLAWSLTLYSRPETLSLSPSTEPGPALFHARLSAGKPCWKGLAALGKRTEVKGLSACQISAASLCPGIVHHILTVATRMQKPNGRRNDHNRCKRPFLDYFAKSLEGHSRNGRANTLLQER
jgi:hypothetical protein